MKSKGQILSFFIFFIAIFIFILTGSLVWVYSYLNYLGREIAKLQAFNIAESGIEYYRWYINHFPQDYTGANNRYSFKNRLGEEIGEFIIEANPPEIGSTIIQVRSTGLLKNYPSIIKKIVAFLAKPSLVKYSVVVDDNIRFGVGTVVYGEIHSNKGIRFDGIAYNLVKSALITYSDPDHSGCKEWAVHTHVSPQDPCPSLPANPDNLPQRPDIFKAGRKVGVPSVDFIGLTADLQQLKQLAIASGTYIGFSGDRNYGYEIILKENGTFDLYKVTQIVSQPSRCVIYDTYEGYGNNSRFQHSTWSIANKQFIGTYNIPNNGIVFVEDNVWVSGKINNKKITIASAIFPESPSKMTNIIINNDLLYTNYDGRDAIGLIAQKNINVGLRSEDDLRIDAALIAKNGRVGRYYYNYYCDPVYYKREKITVYGAIITRFRYGFSWVSGDTWVSGYRLRELIYNNNLLYFPPPYFPLASEFYENIKWLEIQ